MREIKFRAWDDSISRMISWDELQLRDDDSKSFYGLDRILAGESHHYHPEQYTGLKDKNGKEIYEGDILHFDIQDYGGGDHLYTLPVEYIIDGFGCVSHKYDSFFSIGHIQVEDDEWEVIGNIHENPELLK